MAEPSCPRINDQKKAENCHPKGVDLSPEPCGRNEKIKLKKKKMKKRGDKKKDNKTFGVWMYAQREIVDSVLYPGVSTFFVHLPHDF